MKIRLAFVVIAAVTVAVLLLRQPTPTTTYQITLQSNPYPLVIGQTTLFVSVTDESGTTVDADIAVSTQMMHDGMLPLYPRVVAYEDGMHQVPVIWPMVGQWVVDVAAQLPDGEQIAQEQFEIYIYPITMRAPDTEVAFRRVSESATLVSDPSRELAIIIPQGTKALMNAMQGEDVIPSEILLDVDGRNTLILQNNDIVDHVVGPFTIRAGEVIRQTFTRPAEYVGRCSANLNAEVSIIVEG
jgi:hypothetical protein